MVTVAHTVPLVLLISLVAVYTATRSLNVVKHHNRMREDINVHFSNK